MNLSAPPFRGWAGGPMVLGKLPVPGRPTNLDYSRARAYCFCSRCRLGLFGHFFSRLIISLFLFPTLWEKARKKLKYCLKGPLNPKTTNQSPLSTPYRPHLVEAQPALTLSILETRSVQALKFTQHHSPT